MPAAERIVLELADGVAIVLPGNPGEATLRLDVSDSINADKTQIMDIGSARTLPNADAIKTIVTAGAATATRTLAVDKTVAMCTHATDTGVHLILSPRFDSTAAYQRLA